MEIKYYKEKLERELKLLEEELQTVGRRNPDNPADWEATADNKMNKGHNPDQDEVSDNIEEYEIRSAILKDLEIRFNNVKNALTRIDADKYGRCDICEKEIEKERLEANPAATTCIEHKQ